MACKPKTSYCYAVLDLRPAMRNSKLICLDSDSVITNYLEAARSAWLEAYGELLPLVDPDAYYAYNAFGIAPEQVEDFYQKLYAVFGHKHWRQMPLLPGAVEACHILLNKGYDLACVTAMPKVHADARALCFKDQGIPINIVYAEERTPGAVDENPKLDRITLLEPAFFVDDLLSNFEGINSDVHCAWIDGGYSDKPNEALVGNGLHSSTYRTLLEFAQVVPGYTP